MRTFKLIVVLGLGLLLAYQKYASVPRPSETGAQPRQSQSSEISVAPESVPQKALQVLQIVRETGLPPEGYVGGRVFQNREGRLPADGDYREFDVDPHRGGRNAERIIVEWNSKQAWYTNDHYQTFVPLP